MTVRLKDVMASTLPEYGYNDTQHLTRTETKIIALVKSNVSLFSVFTIIFPESSTILDQHV